MTDRPSHPMDLRERYKKTLAQIPLFSQVPLEEQKIILCTIIPRHFDAGQVIYLEGEPAEYIYVLERGWVKGTRMTAEGREQGLLFLRPVEIFGDIAAFTNKVYPGTATALEPVDVLLIPSETFTRVVTRYPEMALAVIRRLSERVLHYIRLVEDLSLKSVEARLAGTLLQHAEPSGGVLIVQRRDWTTFDEMAVRLGTVRDVLSRSLKTLESEGLLKVEKKDILLLDPKGLAERANQ